MRGLILLLLLCGHLLSTELHSGSAVQPGTDYHPLLILLLLATVLVLLLLLLGYRHRVLSTENSELKRLHERLRKKAWQIQEHKQVHELVFEHARDGILIMEDGRFTDCNRSIVSMLEYDSKEALLKLHPSEFSPEFQPDGRRSGEKADEMIALAFKNGGHRFEWVHKTATGREIWFEVALTPVIVDGKELLYAVCRDISERKRLEFAHAELNRTLESQIETALNDLKKSQAQAKLGSWKLDIDANRLTWSDETYNIFELPKKSEIATYENFLKAIHPDDLERVNAAYFNSLETKQPYSIKHRVVTPDGRVKYVKEQCETTFDADGTALISVGTIQDITSEHLANEELRHKDELLFQQSRMAQMGEMISMIAHQWRQPLNAISLTTASLALKAKLGQFDPHYFDSRLERVSDYVQHLSSTIEDFRNFFKPEKAKRATNFSEIVEKTMGIVHSELESRNITVATSCNCTNTLYTYANELLQVTLNLIKNAEDVLVENAVEEPTITIRCYGDENGAVLEVHDNGGGVDESLLEKIFDPYFTTKEEHNGTGLGLYMSKIIVEEHCGGRLSVSNRDGGALFSIRLNRTDVPVAAAE